MYGRCCRQLTAPPAEADLSGAAAAALRLSQTAAEHAAALPRRLSLIVPQPQLHLTAQRSLHTSHSSRRTARHSCTDRKTLSPCCPAARCIIVHSSHRRHLPKCGCDRHAHRSWHLACRLFPTLLSCLTSPAPPVAHSPAGHARTSNCTSARCRRTGGIEACWLTAAPPSLCCSRSRRLLAHHPHS